MIMINHRRYLYWTIGGDENDRRTNQGAARGAGLDAGRACPADEHYAQRRQLVGTGAFHAVSDLSGGFGKGVLRLDGLSAWGRTAGNGQCHRLDEKDVAMLAQLADRLREKR